MRLPSAESAALDQDLKRPQAQEPLGYLKGKSIGLVSFENMDFTLADQLGLGGRWPIMFGHSTLITILYFCSTQIRLNIQQIFANSSAFGIDSNLLLSSASERPRKSHRTLPKRF